MLLYSEIVHRLFQLFPLILSQGRTHDLFDRFDRIQRKISLNIIFYRDQVVADVLTILFIIINLALNFLDQLNSSKFVKLFLLDLQNLALKGEIVSHQLCCVLIKLL